MALIDLSDTDVVCWFANANVSPSVHIMYGVMNWAMWFESILSFRLKQFIILKSSVNAVWHPLGKLTKKSLKSLIFSPGLSASASLLNSAWRPFGINGFLICRRNSFTISCDICWTVRFHVSTKSRPKFFHSKSDILEISIALWLIWIWYELVLSNKHNIWLNEKRLLRWPAKAQPFID